MARRNATRTLAAAIAPAVRMAVLVSMLSASGAGAWQLPETFKPKAPVDREMAPRGHHKPTACTTRTGHGEGATRAAATSQAEADVAARAASLSYGPDPSIIVIGPTCRPIQDIGHPGYSCSITWKVCRA